jgi:hypothetical protein
VTERRQLVVVRRPERGLSVSYDRQERHSELFVRVLSQLAPRHLPPVDRVGTIGKT